MKTLPTVIGGLAASALLLTAHAQAPATSPGNPNLTKPGPATAKGRGIDSKKLGNKMLQKSRPADVPGRVKPRPFIVK